MASPVAILFNTDGVEVNVKHNNALQANVSAILMAGSNGTNSLILRTNSTGVLLTEGTGTAGNPSSGVISVQGISGGTPLPVSGSFSVLPQSPHPSSYLPVRLTDEASFYIAGGEGGGLIAAVSATQSGVRNVGTVTAVTSITNLVAVTDNGSTLSIDDGGSSLTVDSTQLPAALVNGRLSVVQDATGTLANGAETSVSSSAVSVLAANASRKVAIIQNTGSNNVRVGVTGVTATTGLRLTPGSSLILEPPFFTTQAIFAIRESADSTVFTMEIT